MYVRVLLHLRRSKDACLAEPVRTQADDGFRLVFVFALASVVLGLSAYLSSRLLPYDGVVIAFPNRITS